MISQQNGLLILNKPSGMSSARCSNFLKKIGQKKIGHAGTLDPMATGVLILLLGNGTKISKYLMEDGGKTYLAEAELGKTSDTWDIEGEILSNSDTSNVTEDAVKEIILSWLGKSEQEVPPISAAKHNGQALYKLARKGLEVPRKFKEIDISEIEVLNIDLPLVTFRVKCSSGTYIRSLAHSLGTRLGCGAVLTKLTREYSHPFELSEAHELDAIINNPESLTELVIPLQNALDWQQIIINPNVVNEIMLGKAIPADNNNELGAKAILIDETDCAIALVELKLIDGKKFWTILRGLWN